MATHRSSIIKSLAESFKGIDGTSKYNSNLYRNVEPKLKFWDEVNDYPYVCVTAGPESREYLPAAFTWGLLEASIKIYVKSDTANEDLENILQDVESVLDDSTTRIYEGGRMEEIRILNISTDEGLLHPHGVGEVIIEIRYQVS